MKRVSGGTARAAPLASRLKAYAAVAVATAGLIAASDQIYSRFKDWQLGRDAVAAIVKVISDRTPNAPPTFILTVGGDHYADNPNAAAIESAIRAASKKDEGEKFIILERSDREFIQALMAAENEWYLEYRAGQMERLGVRPVLFGCDNQVQTETVVKAIQSYRDDNISWTELCSWRRVVF